MSFAFSSFFAFVGVYVDDLPDEEFRGTCPPIDLKLRWHNLPNIL